MLWSLLSEHWKALQGHSVSVIIMDTILKPKAKIYISMLRSDRDRKITTRKWAKSNIPLASGKQI